jgi:hypothetical protein
LCRTGDIHPDQPHGLFFRDTRLLSRWQLLVDDAPPQPLAMMEAEPFATTFVARARPRAGRADSTLLVQRHRYVGDGMREDLVLRNFDALASAGHDRDVSGQGFGVQPPGGDQQLGPLLDTVSRAR